MDGMDAGPGSRFSIPELNSRSPPKVFGAPKSRPYGWMVDFTVEWSRLGMPKSGGDEKAKKGVKRGKTMGFVDIRQNNARNGTMSLRLKFGCKTQHAWMAPKWAKNDTLYLYRKP